MPAPGPDCAECMPAEPIGLWSDCTCLPKGGLEVLAGMAERFKAQNPSRV